MAKKLIKGVGKVVGIGKKTADPVESATPTPVSGPIVTKLKADDPRRRRKPSLLGSVFGGTDRLGG